MIDPVVAWDKLSNFETWQEIREYFQSEGVKGHKGGVASCAIAVWLTTITGESGVSVSDTIQIGVKESKYECDRWVVNTPTHEFDHTYATEAFMDKFDEGEFPELEFDAWSEY